MHTKFMLAAAALCAAAWLAPMAAQAGPVNAAEPVALLNVTLLDGTDLSDTTGLALDGGITTARGAGDFQVIPAGTMVAVSGPLYLYTALGGQGADAFSFTIGSFGSFVATATPLILNRSATVTSSGLDAYLLGLFTPAGALAADFTPGPASFHVAFTRSTATPASGTSAEIASNSGSGTFASPPAPVPTVVTEPGSLSLLAVGPGLMCLAAGGQGAARRRATAQASARIEVA